MKVVIWDGWTNKYYRTVDDPALDAWYWEEGNGSCDCNRVEYNSPEKAELEGERGPGICIGCRRYIIVSVDNDVPSIEMNSEYDPNMVARALIAYWNKHD